MSKHVTIKATFDPKGMRLLEEVKNELLADSYDEIFRRAIIAYQYLQPAVQTPANQQTHFDPQKVEKLRTQPITCYLSEPVHKLLLKHQEDTGKKTAEVLGECLNVFSQLLRNRKQIDKKILQGENVSATELVSLIYSS